MILFDPATARDLRDALRLLEGRLRGTGRTLAPGTAEILSFAQRSGAVTSVHAVDTLDDGGDGEQMALELLTESDAADRLQVSLSSVKRLVRNGALPVVRINRSVRVRPQDLAAYIENLTAVSDAS